MKNLFLATIVIAGIALIGQPSTASANVLTNPGFESGLTGWFAVGDHATYTATWAAHSGTNGGVINAAGTGTGLLLQEITSVNPGDTVNFTGWSSGSWDLATGSGSLAIEFWNGGGKLSGGNSVTHVGSYAYLSDSISAVAPTGTTYAKVLLGASGPSTTAPGVVMFDDLDATVTTAPVPEPTSLLLLGSGLVGLLGISRKKIK